MSDASPPAPVAAEASRLERQLAFVVEIDRLALRARDALDRSGHFKVPVVTEIVADAPFWRGEEYHQHFADRNPARYGAYRLGCGRDARLRELWGNAASPYVPAH